MTDFNSLFSTLVKQAAEEVVAEVVFITSTKVVGSAENLAKTLENAQQLTTAAKENAGIVI